MGLSVVHTTAGVRTAQARSRRSFATRQHNAEGRTGLPLSKLLKTSAWHIRCVWLTTGPCEMVAVVAGRCAAVAAAAAGCAAGALT